jgi:hypothetical protein
MLWHGLNPQERPAWTQRLDPEKILDTASQPITVLAMRILEWVRPDRGRFIRHQLAYTAAQERQSQGMVPLKDIEPGHLDVAPRLHTRLPPALEDRVALVQAILPEVRPHSLEFWIDGFLRDHAPEYNVAWWERYAAMYLEAVCGVDWLQEKSRKGVFQIFRRQAPRVEHADVDIMLDGLLHAGAVQERLSEFQQRYPANIMDVIAAIIQSPTVIEVLGE